MEIDTLAKLKTTPEFKLLFSLFLGFIIGLERELRAKFGHDLFAGVRTFPLISVLGTVSGLAFVLKGSESLLALSFLALSLLATLSYWKDKSIGITTEVAALITFLIGVFVAFGEYYLSTLLTIITTFLLVLRKRLESLAKRLEEEDIIAILKFFTLSAVILPIVPDRELLPGFNPAEVWKFVILVSTVDFLAYFLLKYKGAQSLIITALVGGLASSTAVTVAYSDISRKLPQYSAFLFFASILAWEVMFLRLLFYSTVVFKGLFWHTFKTLFPYFFVLFLFALAVYAKTKREDPRQRSVSLKNPYSLSQALTFGLIYSAISVASRYLQESFGDAGIYVLSFLSGLVDVDAITLLLARLAKEGSITQDVAALGIFLAASSNNLFKSAYAVLFGAGAMRTLFGIVFLITLAYLLLTLFFLLS
ncbi:MAG: MgtC/SapB family protein [Aquificae bacterium]|nr:MgtC/SapB family protein [Aquificota bacterium]